MVYVVFFNYSHKEEITTEKLANAKVFIIAGPREKFTSPEVHNFYFYFLKDQITTMQVELISSITIIWFQPPCHPAVWR